MTPDEPAASEETSDTIDVREGKACMGDGTVDSVEVVEVEG